MARSTTVPTLAQAGVVLNYSCELRIATADASIAAGDFAYLGTRIEGYNWRQFAQSPFTLSFWVMGAKTGTHCVAFRNNAAGTPDRCYIGTYSINSANTWEYKTITVSPSPSAGTWDYTTGAGLEVAFVLAAGSTFQTTAGAWNTGNFLGTSAQVNELDSTSNFFRITGVRMEARPIATPLAYVSFAEELARCQRYYQKSFLYGTVSAQNIGLDTGEFTFPSPVSGATPISCPSIPLKHMRAAPTVALYNPSATNAQFRNRSLSADCSSTSVNNASDKNFHVVLTTAASTSAGHTLSIHWQAVAEL